MIGWLLIAAVVIGFLLVWEHASQTRMISRLFYPPPSVIAQTLSKWFTTTEWQEILLPTLRRLAGGFVFGMLIGYVGGLFIGYSATLYRYADPILSFIHPMPKIALLPLALVVFGLGDTPHRIVIGLAAFFPMVINTTAGVRAINPNYFAIGKVYHVRPLTVFRRVLIPGSLPSVVSGLRLSFNSSFVITIAIELNSARDGLGHVVWLAWETMRTEYLFAGVFLIALIGVIATSILRYLHRSILRWQT